MLPLSEIVLELKARQKELDEQRKGIEDKLKELIPLNKEAENLLHQSTSIGFAIYRLEQLSSNDPEEPPEVLNESAWGDIDHVR